VARQKSGRVKGAAVTGERPLVVVGYPEAGIGEITLDRPDQRNSLSLQMIRALHEAVGAMAVDPQVQAIMLSANGPAFCAGHDLKEISARRADPDAGRGFFDEAMSSCAAMMQAIVACAKPVIAVVQGTATASGCQLVATCDLAVAAEDAQFCTPGVNIGLFCSTPMVALTRNVPAKRAMEMLLLGELIDATRAAAWGLVNRVVPRDGVREEALSIARQIAAKSPLTVAMGKRAFYDQMAMPLGDAYALAARVMVENLMARDAVEGISAFVAKRPPAWEGR
jgi:enoyl-CoA hydratase/carnithine racemase